MEKKPTVLLVLDGGKITYNADMHGLEEAGYEVHMAGQAGGA